ncbi:MAG: hypothetical protein LH702_07885 [Phormidesmis sp. CAN_BIN44]|nr:hypothetical protein [Phormidesmis sp. CAN_BIN44]
MTLFTSSRIDSDLQVLLLNAISSYKQGRSKSNSSKINFDEQFNSYLLREMSKRISLPDISTLLQATEVREYGLTLAKAGSVLDGEKAIESARSICLQACLSREAFTISESFQAAAVAYIQYKKKLYSEACESLLFSLKSCQILKDEYAYNVEVRRIHLVRNIVRVKLFSDSLDEATKLASFMIRYIEGDDVFWPFPEQALLSSPDLLEVEVRWVLLDQFLGEIALLLGKQKAVARKLLEIIELYLFGGDFNVANDFLRVHIWMSAMRAFVEDDIVEFLNNANIFFSEGPDYMYQAWQAITIALNQVCNTISPDKSLALNTEES